MISVLSQTKKAEPLFSGREDTMIFSCLEGVMGEVFVTDADAPRSACARLGDFAFFAGEPEKELLGAVPTRFCILVPQNEGWASLIEEAFPEARPVTRYAIRKDTRFDPEKLRGFVNGLPEGYVLKKIDGPLYEACLVDPAMKDLVSVFADKQTFLSLGRGTVVLKDGQIVSGASSYTRYRGGIEIEVDTKREERRRHLALAACADLILSCLGDGLYPSWDAQNIGSVHLAEKLGYTFSHVYTAYEIG